MPKAIPALLFMTCAIAAASHAQVAPRSDFLHLGSLVVGGNSVANGINDNGQMAGTSSSSSGYRAFLYSSGTMLDLGTLGGLNSQGQALNNRGQVAGYSNANGNEAAFLYSGGPLVNLGTLGGSTSRAMGINDAGQVVGESRTAGNMRLNAFLWSPNGNMQDLTIQSGYDQGIALAINAGGTVVGWHTSGVPNAYVYNPANGYAQTICCLGGGSETRANAVNAAGTVVGGGFTAPGRDRHAFRYVPGGIYSYGGLQDLGTLEGNSSDALAINDTGQIVGTSGQKAFLWDAGTMHDLNLLAPAGWVLVEARGINKYAQIAGRAYQAGVSEEGFRLTLQPDWQGGNGSWDDYSRWNFSGLGALTGLTPGAPHDVVIRPGISATVLGPVDARINSLVVSGSPGKLVTLNLNGGSIYASSGSSIEAQGTLAGSGRIDGQLVLNAEARINLAGGDFMQATNGTLNNFGIIRALGAAGTPATLEVAGLTRNQANAQINLQNANVSFLGGLDNRGQLSVSFGITNIAGIVNNQAAGSGNGMTAPLSKGRIMVGSQSYASFYDRVLQNGDFIVSQGAVANFFGLVTGAGNFTGTGSVAFAGGYSPGNSPAQVSIGGNVDFLGGQLTMELGGTAPGSAHDKIVFFGPVSIQGTTLAVELWAGWTPRAGDTYDLFDWNGGVTGTFSAVSLPALGNGLSWQVQDLYGGGSLAVAAVPEPFTHALLIAGLALVGAAVRAKSRQTATP